MRIDHDVPLAALTTLRLGGPTPVLLTAESDDDVIAAVHQHHRTGLLIIGGGSNLVVADDGVTVPVLKVATTGVDVQMTGDEVSLTVAAGESWDALVNRAVDEGWTGIEALSGIPGLVGATPIQNVGAYGQELSEVCTAVDVIDRESGRAHTMTAAECAFGYRSSTFKSAQDRYVVMRVRLRLARGTQGQPTRYAELAEQLGIAEGDTAPLRSVREAVLDVRRSKAMVLDDADHDTWSAGSFFTNPLVSADTALPPDAPRWPQPDGRTKTSAAWLIQRAGFTRGFGEPVGRGAIALSSKHVLALTNRGDGTTAELLSLARLIRDSVKDRFGVELQPEPRIVGTRL